jgi:hypothetical protein
VLRPWKKWRGHVTWHEHGGRVSNTLETARQGPCRMREEETGCWVVEPKGIGLTLTRSMGMPPVPLHCSMKRLRSTSKNSKTR